MSDDFETAARAMGRALAKIECDVYAGEMTLNERIEVARAALVAEIVAWLRDGEKEFSDCDIAAHLLETGMWKQ